MENSECETEEVEVDISSIAVAKAIQQMQKVASRSRKKRTRVLSDIVQYMHTGFRMAQTQEDVMQDILDRIDEFIHLIMDALNLLLPLSNYSSKDEMISVISTDFFESLQILVHSLRAWCTEDPERPDFMLVSSKLLSKFLDYVATNIDSWFYVIVIGPIVTYIIWHWGNETEKSKMCDWSMRSVNTIYQLGKGLLTCGDFSCQYLFMLMIQQWLGWVDDQTGWKFINTCFANIESGLRKSLKANALFDGDYSARVFLNGINASNGGPKKIMSIPCLHFFAGEDEIKPPEHSEISDFWVDFSSGSGRIHVFCTLEESIWTDINFEAEVIDSVCVSWARKKTGRSTLCETPCTDTQMSRLTNLSHESLCFLHIRLKDKCFPASKDVEYFCTSERQSLFFVFKDIVKAEEAVMMMNFHVHACGEKLCSRPPRLEAMIRETASLNVAQSVGSVSEIYDERENLRDEDEDVRDEVEPLTENPYVSLAGESNCIVPNIKVPDRPQTPFALSGGSTKENFYETAETEYQVTTYSCLSKLEQKRTRVIETPEGFNIFESDEDDNIPVDRKEGSSESNESWNDECNNNRSNFNLSAATVESFMEDPMPRSRRTNKNTQFQLKFMSPSSQMSTRPLNEVVRNNVRPHTPFAPFVTPSQCPSAISFAENCEAKDILTDEDDEFTRDTTRGYSKRFSSTPNSKNRSLDLFEDCEWNEECSIVHQKYKDVDVAQQAISSTPSTHQATPFTPVMHQEIPSTPLIDETLPSLPSTPLRHQPRPSTPLMDETIPSLPSTPLRHQPRPSTPFRHQPRPSTPLRHQPRPSTPLMDETIPSLPSTPLRHQPRPSSPLMDEDEAIPSTPLKDEAIPSLLSTPLRHQPRPSTPLMDEDEAIPSSPLMDKDEAIPSTPLRDKDEARPSTPLMDEDEAIPSSPLMDEDDAIPSSPLDEDDAIPSTPLRHQPRPSTPHIHQTIPVIPSTPQADPVFNSGSGIVSDEPFFNVKKRTAKLMDTSSRPQQDLNITKFIPKPSLGPNVSKNSVIQENTSASSPETSKETYHLRHLENTQIQLYSSSDDSSVCTNKCRKSGFKPSLMQTNVDSNVALVPVANVCGDYSDSQIQIYSQDMELSVVKPKEKTPKPQPKKLGKGFVGGRPKKGRETRKPVPVRPVCLSFSSSESEDDKDKSFIQNAESNQNGIANVEMPLKGVLHANQDQVVCDIQNDAADTPHIDDLKNSKSATKAKTKHKDIRPNDVTNIARDSDSENESTAKHVARKRKRNAKNRLMFSSDEEDCVGNIPQRPMKKRKAPAVKLPRKAKTAPRVLENSFQNALPIKVLNPCPKVPGRTPCYLLRNTRQVDPIPICDTSSTQFKDPYDFERSYDFIKETSMNMKTYARSKRKTSSKPPQLPRIDIDDGNRSDDSIDKILQNLPEKKPRGRPKGTKKINKTSGTAAKPINKKSRKKSSDMLKQSNPKCKPTKTKNTGDGSEPKKTRKASKKKEGTPTVVLRPRGRPRKSKTSVPTDGKQKTKIIASSKQSIDDTSEEHLNDDIMPPPSKHSSDHIFFENLNENRVVSSSKQSADEKSYERLNDEIKASPFPANQARDDTFDEHHNDDKIKKILAKLNIPSTPKREKLPALNCTSSENAEATNFLDDTFDWDDISKSRSAVAASVRDLDDTFDWDNLDI